MKKNLDLWLSKQQTFKEPMYRIICFPHAGGAASFFKNWAKNLPSFELYSVRYPGRAERIDESQPTDLIEIAEAVATIIEPVAQLPLILFGHSMGAVVALETARSLEKKGIEIKHLFASGSRNGPLLKETMNIEEDNAELCKHLVEMGGTDSEAIKDPLFLELILPSIRADGKMFSQYKMNFQPKLQCSITTIYGESDGHADVRPWQKITSGKFEENSVSGNHFYLISNPPYNLINKIGLHD